MQRIDSHQHFWRFEPVRYSWITDDLKVIQKDFLPEDLAPLLKEHNIDGCVAVQADPSEEENVFLLELAAANPFIKGVVGWVDFTAENIRETLEFYKGYDKMKGFRAMLQSEKDRAFMLRDDFKRGIALLDDFGYAYDILINADQVKYSDEFAGLFPNQKFVIDHIAKPYIKDKKIDEWAADIKAIAKHENVSCKISGMITEADWSNWKSEDFTPYLDVVFEAFGAKRVMYGSDWPVSLLAGDYRQVVDLVKDYTARLTENEQGLFWGENAINFYNLK